jgi:hypothetical protein
VTKRETLLTDWAACGRLDKPPRDQCYIRLPESFGRRFILFVDTEEEFDWSRPLSRDNRSTRAMRAMPAMHQKMRLAGAIPVYLIDHPIVMDSQAVAMLRDWQDRGECVIGTQLHPWVNPPFEEEVTPFNSFTGNLPIELQRAKLAALTEAIEQAFGRRPIVYRAGRYGVGAHTAELLEEAGYRLDVSVRALFDYSGVAGPDFSRVRPEPYWVGDCALLELPLSAAFTGLLRRWGTSLYPASARLPHLRSLLSRTGLLTRVALTPEDMPLADALVATGHLLDEGAQVISISFHSPSVEPGHTPYVRTGAELAHFHAWWDGMFDFLARRDVRPASIDELLAAAEVMAGTRTQVEPIAVP